MPLVMPKADADFEPVPEGAHLAVCYRVIDLGTQDGTYLGKPTRKHLILLTWELPDAKMQDGRPFSVSRRYTYSASPKANLRKDLESWRGKRFEEWEFGSFDIGKLIGAPCMLNIVHEQKGENTYSNIAAIMRLPAGMPKPHITNDPVYFSLSDRPFDWTSFEKLGERLQEVIKRSPEFASAVEGRDPNEGPPPPAGEGDYGAELEDAVPF